jgi:hypothetical protein
VSKSTAKARERGQKPDWKELPARRCDNCPKVFKPKRPEQRFCSPQCRWQADRQGPGYARLKVRVEKDLNSIRHQLRTDLKADVEKAVKHLESVIKKTLLTSKLSSVPIPEESALETQRRTNVE